MEAGWESIAEPFCESAEGFAAIARDSPPSPTASLSSFCAMTDLHSAAFGEFLPACLGLRCFLLSPLAHPDSQSPGELTFFQPLECQKNSKISHIRESFGGVGWGVGG